MFDLTIEIHPYDLETGIDGFTTANMNIKGDYGFLTSKRDKAPFQDMMIFISLSDLLDSIVNLVKKGAKEYEFVGVDSSFIFFINNKKGSYILSDSSKQVIAKSTEKELVQSIWDGVSNFYNTYRPLVKEVDGAIKDLDNSIEKFKTQFLDVLSQQIKN